MSKYDFKLPDIGEGVMEGEIVKWLVSRGDAVAEDQPMVEVMTDKATVTITSPKTGRILELGGEEGAIVAVHSTLVMIELTDGAAAGASPDVAAPEPKPEPVPAPKPEPKPEPAATAVGDIRESLPGTQLSSGQRSVAPSPPAGSAQTPPASSYFNEKPLATPATRKLARDLGVDLRHVAPTGRHGRVSKDDVRAAGNAPAEAPPAGVAPTVASVGGLGRAPIVVPATDSETRTPLKGVRKRIFENMARSKHTAAHFTFVEECDVTALQALRERLKPHAASQGVKLSYLPFIVKAVVAALKKHPSLNSAFDESTQEIVERHHYNIGIASATEAGLVVPVVHDADRRSVLDIAREIERLGEATKSGRINPDDLRGSTFTITSLGKNGGLFATPILNTPEVGILGIHQMKEKPVVRGGEIVIGNVMLLSLSFDHRLIDGHVGAAFAYEIIGYLQDPDSLWLEMS